MDWTNISISPDAIEFVLRVGLPALLAIGTAGLGLFGLDKVIAQLQAIWRRFRPLVDEETDPLFVLLMAVTKLTPEQLAKIRAEIDKQLEGEPLAERGK
jgi:hypothetical protein